MKLVQKILSHGLLIAFFVAVFFLYLYRQSLFPQWFGTESQSVAQQTESTQQERATAEPAPATAMAEPPQASASAATGQAVEAGAADLPSLAGADTAAPADDSLPPMAGEAAPSQASPEDTRPAQPAVAPQAQGSGADDMPSPAEASVAAAYPDTDVSAQYRPLEEAESDAAMGTDATPASPQPETEAAGISAPAATTQTTPADVSQPAQQPAYAAPAAEDASPQYRPLQQQPREPPESYRAPQAAQRSAAYPAVAAPQSTHDTRNVAQAEPEFRAGLAEAREIFWSGDLRGAEMRYRNLVESWPEQADGWGELGNLYLTMDQRAMAAEAYHKATGLLIDQGETLRAQHVLRMLHGLDPQKAGELEQRLRQSGG
ncbi:MAG: hypothetical protein J5I92_03815 [Thiogranum sp.]|nr:hypothetical protein [Thiogranum sp.]